MAKLFASDTAKHITVEAVQVLGGYGYVTKYQFEQMMRDAKVKQSTTTPTRPQRLVVARHLAR